MNQNEIKKIEESAKEFFEKMTFPALSLQAKISPLEEGSTEENGIAKECLDLDVKIDEPQILIGQGGQTLFEMQKLLRTILNKKTGKIFYLNLDINDYKKKKVEYLKDVAKELADQVSLDGKEKVMIPMPPYERRVIHAELSQRADVVTESRGHGQERHIVIRPK